MPDARVQMPARPVRAHRPARRGATLHREPGGWSRLIRPAAAREISLDRAAQRPALWRPILSPNRRRGSWAADFPTLRLDSEDHAALADWLRAAFSAAPAEPSAWTAPLEADLAEWLPPAARTLRCGRELRELRVLREEHALVLRVALAPLFPATAPGGALAERMLLDWQDRVRMARFVADPAEGLVAETDLTGAPAAAAEFLVQAAADCLRHAVGPILPALRRLRENMPWLAGIAFLWDRPAATEAQEEERRTP